MTAIGTCHVSSNPYAPTDNESNNQPEESIRPRFPFWTMGPLPWISATLLGGFISSIGLNIINFNADASKSITLLAHLSILALEAAILAGLFGMFYGYALSVINGILNVPPRPKPHFQRFSPIIRSTPDWFREVPNILSSSPEDHTKGTMNPEVLERGRGRFVWRSKDDQPGPRCGESDR